MPLLEREAQLALLDRYAGEARQGDGRLVFIAGEAGVGKSALVEQAQRGLPETTWCWGACDGMFTPRPLGPLFDIASTLGGELLELCRADAPREELFSALLGQASTPGELHVLVVEDVHWADEATIDLLRFLGRPTSQNSPICTTPAPSKVDLSTAQNAGDARACYPRIDHVLRSVQARMGTRIGTASVGDGVPSWR